MAFSNETLPSFNIHPDTIEPEIRKRLSENRQTIKHLLAEGSPFTWDNLMQPLEIMSDKLNQYWSPISHMHAVMQTPELRKAYNQVLPLLTEYHSEILHNEALYQAILSIQNRDDFKNLHPAQRKIIENDIRDLKLAGVHLSPETKAHLTGLQTKLGQLTTHFSENILDATQAFCYHTQDVTVLAGLPQQALQLAMENAKHRKLTGYVLTLDYPSYSTAIRFLDNRELRKTLYTAYVTRASELGDKKYDNTPVMEAILNTRHEIAKLLEFHNYAEFSLATKMAKTVDEVLHFLQDLVEKSKPTAEKEYKTIVDFAQRKDGLNTLEAWDVPYYSEKLQEATFNFSQEDLRPYFPIEKVLNGLFVIVNKLYGITIRREKEVEVWQRDVQFFSVYDEQNALRGGFFIDLYARAHKRDGAWMDDCRIRRRLDDGSIQHPIAYLTCNFMPPLEDKPGLLTHDDVLTLFHEFGHCLHHLLTQVDYPSVAGINGVPWDAVELPSQFMENFCWEREGIDLLSGHYETGASLPTDLYNNMLAAKHFLTGLQMVRQLEFALFDFHLHLDYDPNQLGQIQTILNQARKDAAVIPTPDFNRFQHSFSHIFAGGYAAGYYSYKWAEVLSADAFSKFEEQGIFDHLTGQSFMKNILEVGGVRDPMTSFVAFRGRKPSIDALLKHSGLVTD